MRRNALFYQDFFQSEPRQYAYQFGQYAYFFSKRASGMLINDMLIKKNMYTISGMDMLDELTAQLGSCVPVDVMPGASDPASQFLPQQVVVAMET